MGVYQYVDQKYLDRYLAEQSKRFIEAAKKAEADETDEGAERAFKKVAGKKPAEPSKSEVP
jgi:hypothetical protein